jgi:hypothetical protein
MKALCVSAVLLALLAVAGAAAPARADYPEVVECKVLDASQVGHGSDASTLVGRIHAPDCWKFFKGCRP